MVRGRRWKVPALLLIGGCALNTAAQTNTTIQVPLKSGDFIAVVTFDESRHPAEDVKRWMELSEQGFYSEPQPPGYQCEWEGTSDFIPRYRTSIDETAQLIKELDPRNYPRELSEVVTYLRRWQSFWLWKNEQELEFLSVGRQPPTQWEDIESGHRCHWTIDKLRRAKNPLQKCKAVLFDWGNCMNKAVEDQIGTYPKESWQAFIRSQGLQVQMLFTEAD
jgi:hypothetical protein